MACGWISRSAYRIKMVFLPWFKFGVLTGWDRSNWQRENCIYEQKRHVWIHGYAIRALQCPSDVWKTHGNHFGRSSFGGMLNLLWWCHCIRKIFWRYGTELGDGIRKVSRAGLKLRPRKCNLFSKEVEFLGHIISESGIKTDLNKTKCAETWPTPKNVREVRAFVGLCSYYRRFIYKFSETAKPLHKLT